MWSLDGALQDFIRSCQNSYVTHDELIEELEKAVVMLRNEKAASDQGEAE